MTPTLTLRTSCVARTRCGNYAPPPKPHRPATAGTGPPKPRDALLVIQGPITDAAATTEAAAADSAADSAVDSAADSAVDSAADSAVDAEQLGIQIHAFRCAKMLRAHLSSPSQFVVSARTV